MSNNVKQQAKSDARIAMRLPSCTLELVTRAAKAEDRSMSQMAVRLMQMGLAAMVADGRLAV